MIAVLRALHATRDHAGGKRRRRAQRRRRRRRRELFWRQNQFEKWRQNKSGKIRINSEDKAKGMIITLN